MPTANVFVSDMLSESVALVSGGGTGIGRAIARQLAACGARVAVAGRRPEPLADLVDELSADGVAAMALPLDVREQQAVHDGVQLVMEQLGRIDILVNNAGGQFTAPARELSTNGVRAINRLNVEGTWTVTRTVANQSMIDRGGGRIVNVTIAMQRGVPGLMMGVASRASVHSITRTLGTEWAKHGISVTSVAAGHILTDGLRRYPAQVVDGLARTVPAGRLGTPEEVAACVAFLTSPMGAYLTGTVVTIDGGKSNAGDTFMVDPAAT